MFFYICAYLYTHICILYIYIYICSRACVYAVNVYTAIERERGRERERERARERPFIRQAPRHSFGTRHPRDRAIHGAVVVVVYLVEQLLHLPTQPNRLHAWNCTRSGLRKGSSKQS